MILTTTSEPTGMRDLAAKHYSKLVHVQGIVIQAGKPTVKATAIMLQCAPHPEPPNHEALGPHPDTKPSTLKPESSTQTQTHTLNRKPAPSALNSHPYTPRP